MKKLAIISLFFVSIFTLQAQDGWKLINKTYIKGYISGIIQQGYLFKIDRDYYLITERTLQHIRTRNPNVEIFYNGYDYKLEIEDFGESVICKNIKDVIETQIEGDFEGWEGESIFKLANGQIWQQTSYDYMYHYSYSPYVYIYNFKGLYIMKVEDVDETIYVERLK